MSTFVSKLEERAQSYEPLLIVGKSGSGKTRAALKYHFDAYPRTNRSPFVIDDGDSADTKRFVEKVYGVVSMDRASVSLSRICLDQRWGSLLLENLDAFTKTAYDILETVIPADPKILAGIPVRLIATANSCDRIPEFLQRIFSAHYLPSLEERPTDIPILARYFQQRFMMTNPGCNFKVSTGPWESLEGKQWRNGVRELCSLVERVCSLSTGDITPSDVLFQYHSEGKNIPT